MLLFFPSTRTETTLTVRSGGDESRSDVSPWESSSQRLWTFLVPGLTPHEAKDWEGNRGLSQSERACGVAKAVLLGLGQDMDGILRNRRGFEWKRYKGRNFIREVLGLVEDTRKMREIAVRKMWGRVAVGFGRLKRKVNSAVVCDSLSNAAALTCPKRVAEFDYWT
ncbi:hypothetical protein V6N13_086269 [Hibiscus sabdariffa]|uniref:Uncharacterized protein n=1 Tax=Hibiscus sabdariffa TaxID=183260 RepID=A0ABR2FSP7_9ROSI